MTDYSDFLANKYSELSKDSALSANLDASIVYSMAESAVYKFSLSETDLMTSENLMRYFQMLLNSSEDFSDESKNALLYSLLLASSF